MNWEIIKEILYRLETKYKIDGHEDPIASITLHNDETWTLIIQNDYGESYTIEIGQGFERFHKLLNELKINKFSDKSI